MDELTVNVGAAGYMYSTTANDPKFPLSRHAVYNHMRDILCHAGRVPQTESEYVLVIDTLLDLYFRGYIYLPYS